jgi:probable F420-dependent oxidoreductase
VKFCCQLSWVDPDHFLEIAPVAEEHGWDTIALSDHVVNPDRIEAKYPYNETGERMWDHASPWPDVWVATGMMAAVTTRLRFFQSVYVLPMRDPFTVAKALGTCARMSRHRVTLGVGLGWMSDEFRILGHAFEQRGPRTDEMIEVMRKLWTGKVVEHHGRFFDFPPLSMSPGVGGEVPIVIGGVSEPALRRVARLADGWCPAYLSVEQVRAGIARIRELQKPLGRERRPLSVYSACFDAFDLDGFRRMQDAGVTHVMTTPWLFGEDHVDYSRLVKGASAAEIRDGLRRFADAVIAKL